ncbi:Alpha-amylase [Pediococcus damnosus]|uniref:Alpha-amylase n=1 Tax=Pediococcus damnosus TaxID=51663 RepID=A0A0R2HET4_9LACO|nr:alpha-amylase family glycosyl hydrolase [Pediococcus damnosus]AMV60235.1 Alpha-amylase [Pediococcus damnosus]AMV62760.1 Alpha-amylase [Pediococcus damnosus]AMV64485.1 Alpha-amylase [Pediococcus damnosus]AMV67356.1 Alpha-amylase [Pediococcus damnosus]KJU75174.1 alpha-amylase [Pediococcus damnosus LMG 28219]
MADETSVDLRKLQIYSVFVRNHTQEGTLKALEKDLPRIKALGTDFIWLLPINPIGKVARKGKLGSPYAIQDYRKVDPALGTWDDLVHLADQIHQSGMKLMIDIVYNHTSRDSVLLKDHPEWFLHDETGKLYNKNPEWSDVAELDYSNHDLWSYQIETLKQYAKIVDGFRCDVAPQVPLPFWLEARKEVAKTNPDTVWLAESTGGDYIREIRSKGFWISSDGEIYRAFDMAYDYDIDQDWHDYLSGKSTLADYVNVLNRQDVAYPYNYIKMRDLENHDNLRAHQLIQNENDLLNWTAFSEFQKGAMLVYAGQEYGVKHTPSLFEDDKIHWNTNLDFSGLIKKMHELKQDRIQVAGKYELTSQQNDIVQVQFSQKKEVRIGIFSLKSQSGVAKVKLEDGLYTNLIDGSDVKVKHGVIQINQNPVIIENR